MSPQLIITVKTVTPIFLGGAVAGRLADTIRPASIRGQVRYWLRALLGASIDPSDPKALEKLKAREGSLMGDTKAGSPVRFRVSVPGGSLRYIERNGGGRRMLPHRAVTGGGNALSADAFLEGQTFDIKLSPRPGRFKLPDEVVASTLLWLYLGGLGKRSRRGFGSLQPVKFTAGDGVLSEAAQQQLVNESPADAAALRTQINALLGWAGGVAAVTAGSWPARSAYPILHEKVAGVRVSEPVIGYGVTDYHQAMVPFWKESLRNASAGLMDDRAYGYAIGNSRRASPFHLHIAQSAAGYHQVFTTFWSDPSPDGAAGWAKVGELLDDVETKFGATNLWGRAS